MRNLRVDPRRSNEEIDRLLQRLEKLEAESQELERKIAALPAGQQDAVDGKVVMAGAKRTEPKSPAGSGAP